MREALLEGLLGYFRHAAHEWPACIQRGMDAATLDQCNEIMSEVTFSRELDREGVHTLSLDEFESKLKQYQERLISGSASMR